MSMGMPSLAAASGGRYEVLRRLAVGGMGEIFLARERGRLGFSRLVVIKRMLPDLAERPGYIDMFVDEARIIGHLGHPNICQILELGEDAGLPFLALEYVRGENLTGIYNRAIKRGVTVPRPIPVRVVADVAWALDFAHDAADVDGKPLHIVHRDISPHNVMVSFRGDIKLMDFGIARADNRSHKTDTNQIKGKLAYMAPEQLRNQPLDRRVDVFALGVMLWELTLGRRLFAAATDVETFSKAMSCVVPPPRSIDPSYPPGLEALVMSALSADRDGRMATAGELARGLIAQLATMGAVERSDLAGIMTTLFPDEASAPEDVAVNASWLSNAELELVADTGAELASPPHTAPAPEAPLATSTRAMRRPGATPTPTPPPPPPGDLRLSEAAPAVREPSRARRWLPAALGVVLLGAIGVAVLVLTGPGDRAGDRVGSGDPAPAQPAAAPIDAATAVTTLEEAPVDAAPPPTSKDAARHDDRRSRPAVETDRDRAKEVVGKPPPLDRVKKEPTTGSLAVSSDPVGVVVIDGVRRKTTPFRIELPDGEYEVKVELAEGAGTPRAIATVASGRKTTCRVQHRTLSCSSPQPRR